MRDSISNSLPDQSEFVDDTRETQERALLEDNETLASSCSAERESTRKFGHEITSYGTGRDLPDHDHRIVQSEV